MLFRRHRASPLRLLWADVAPASVASAAVLAAAGPAAWALRRAGAPVPVEILGVVPAGALAYCAVLRARFPASWRDLGAALRRILPARVLRRLGRGPRRPRVPTAPARH
jgi:hypothetical protein